MQCTQRQIRYNLSLMHQDYVVISSSCITYSRYIQGCGAGCWSFGSGIRRGEDPDPNPPKIKITPPHPVFIGQIMRFFRVGSDFV